ncbi:MAG: acyl-CoA desaturase [Flavobacteriales bacterium]|nr:acyl-CoA desaturase [Flavobacteriales bacterium]
MQNLRYLPDEDREKQFAAAVRRNVNTYFKERGLSTKGDGRLVYKTIAMLTLYLAPFVLLLTLPVTGWWAMPFWMVMGVGMAGIGMSVMHDAVHGSASSHAWINRLMGNSMFLLGSNVFTWKVQHNVIHHTHTNVDAVDQDIDPPSLLRFSEHAPLRRIHRFQHIHAFFFYGLLSITKVVFDFVMLSRFNRDGTTRRMGESPVGMMVRIAAAKAVYLAVFIGLPILLTDLAWWQVLLGFLVMHFVGGLILGTVFQLAHVVEGAEQPLPDEHGVFHHDWVVHELLTTANFARNNKLLNWYIGGLNYQIEHHLFPHICHVHYRDIAPIVERTAQEYGLRYNMKPTLREALASHVRRLRELGRPPKPVLIPVPVSRKGS